MYKIGTILKRTYNNQHYVIKGYNTIKGTNSIRDNTTTYLVMKINKNMDNEPSTKYIHESLINLDYKVVSTNSNIGKVLY